MTAEELADAIFEAEPMPGEIARWIKERDALIRRKALEKAAKAADVQAAIFRAVVDEADASTTPPYLNIMNARACGAMDVAAAIRALIQEPVAGPNAAIAVLDAEQLRKKTQ